MPPESERPRIAVAQIGARRHYAIPSILHRAGLLETFYTDLCANLGALRAADLLIPSRLQPAALRRLLGRRAEEVPVEKTVCFAGFALRRALATRRCQTPAQVRRWYVRQNADFCRLVLRCGLAHANTVYVFNGAGLEILQHAKDQGLRTLLEQTSAPVAVEEELLREERERWPGWEFERAAPADWRPVADREEAEWRLADQIICGSSFVAGKVAARNGPADRCSVVPYGLGEAFLQKSPASTHKGPLRVLFVGAIRLQKGIQYLMEAARLLRGVDVCMRAVGPIRVSKPAVAELSCWLELAGPVPRSQIRRQYEWADLFVFPSICEGSANVCYEALAAGLPVITTPNAGSVVRDGVDGYLVPIRSPEALAERITRLANDRGLLEQMSQSAGARARQFTWARYAQRLLTVITEGPVPAAETRPHSPTGQSLHPSGGLGVL